jgi:hypothetical protein
VPAGRNPQPAEPQCNKTVRDVKEISAADTACRAPATSRRLRSGRTGGQSLRAMLVGPRPPKAGHQGLRYLKYGESSARPEHAL